MKAAFVTATGTGIGKTLVISLLCHQLREKGKRVAAFKPVISGFDENAIDTSDTGLLLAAQDLPLTKENVDRVSPWRFKAPVSPDMAAKQEDRAIGFDAVLRYCRRQVVNYSRVTLIEGVGGVMVPLTERRTVLDWIAALDIPALLVTGSYLGSLSHGLTAAQALQSRGTMLAGVIVSESEENPIPVAETAATLKRFIAGAPVVTMPRFADDADVLARAPDLTFLLERERA
jgi:dethiobiotin synthetase